jgi:predicted phosphodiesterase
MRFESFSFPMMLILLITVTFIIVLHQVIDKTERENHIVHALDETNLADFNFAAVGDWNCTPNSKNTVDNIIEKDPELVLGLGDYSYEKTADCWLQLVSPLEHKMRIAIGNHDHQYYITNTTTIPLPSLLQQYMDHFNLTEQFYSFNYQNVHFIAMSTQVPFELNSEQYKFVKSDLEKAVSQPDIDWIIVFYHRLAYTSPALLDSIPKFRNIYHPLFEKYNVDLVIQGHGHNYQRSFPIKYNNITKNDPIVTDKHKTNYLNPNGQIFFVVGTGGAYDSHRFTAPQPEYIVVQFNAYGHLNIDIVKNGTKLIGTFYNNDHSANDKFTIDKLMKKVSR